MLDRSLLALPALLALVFTPQEPAPPPAVAPPPIKKPYVLENRTDELNAIDLDGKAHALAAENPGKTLLVVFWSWRDPVARGYAAKLASIQAAHAEQLAVFLVDANHDEIGVAGDPLAILKDVARREGITLPILVDKGNALADDFDAKTNAEVFLVDANRFLRYRGGIDDDPKGERKKRGIPVLEKLGNALDAVLAGNKPEYAWTIPIGGRPIKRAPKSMAADPGVR